ncbi:GntR family phosphonate transport system transcriptional regulator [Angulomicrobium tetraedrale]|uniref:GntR family phosphonate transport system transcriptional regulator n=1 Tax=Ancylobacter tetraedralis TaxID=217068 RepID=A0A839Z4N4_9HYPH|nr:phosphonate metabolism transcriptional regulator PhnF [Ancylobacter tetraedralis]MBB3769430.1 GntR family phosphonate transport system transcriptional regulator [Ancylobacter tetraedralis]
MSSEGPPKLALWRRVQQDIEQQIRDGSLPPGTRLPSESQLATSFDVHRHTVRRAIARLKEKELVTVVHGKGAYVADHQICYRVGRATRMTTAILRTGRTAQRRVLSSTEIPADKRLAALLSLPVGHPICRVRTLRMIDDQPVSLTTYFYPLPRFAGISRSIAETGSVSEALSRYGVTKMIRNDMHFRASLPSMQEAKTLRIGRSKPLVELLSVNLDASGVPVQHVHGKIVSEALDVVVSLND